MSTLEKLQIETGGSHFIREIRKPNLKMKIFIKETTTQWVIKPGWSSFEFIKAFKHLLSFCSHHKLIINYKFSTFPCNPTSWQVHLFACLSRTETKSHKHSWNSSFNRGENYFAISSWVVWLGSSQAYLPNCQTFALRIHSWRHNLALCGTAERNDCWVQICVWASVSHSRVLCSVQGLAADVGCTMTLRDPKWPVGVSVLGQQKEGDGWLLYWQCTPCFYGVEVISMDY